MIQMKTLKTIHSNSEDSNLFSVSIILTAAGSSTRMGGSIKKEFIPFNSGTVLSSSIKTFLIASKNNFDISNFVITIPQDCIASAKEAVTCDKEIPDSFVQDIHFITGGSTRQESVYNGLKYIKDNSPENIKKIVLIHDGARPFVTQKIILDVLNSANDFGASVPGITPTDTQKEIDENGFVIRHLIRKNLTAVQTPQGFDFEKLFIAHEKCMDINFKTKREFTDDTEIWGEFYGNVKVVPGDINNIKITYPSDLEKLR